jgi:hypothetical protein
MRLPERLVTYLEDAALVLATFAVLEGVTMAFGLAVAQGLIVFALVSR